MSIRAIATAKQLARRFGSTIHLAHLHEFYYPAGFLSPASPLPITPLTFQEEARAVAAERLKALARKHGVTGTCYAEIGGPVFDELCRIARQIPADLIVTPTHGHTGLKHVLLGSTAERLVQHSPCPVLVARERKGKTPLWPATAGISTILVPVDFSKCSAAGLEYAIHFAQKVAARLILLHVVDFGPLLTADGYAMYDLTKYRKMACADAKQEMARFVRGVRFGTVEHRTMVVDGPSVTGICDVAESEKADLIITATHGRTGLKHVLVGSTAEVIIRHAPCPVLVVPSHPEVRSAHLTAHKEALPVARRRGPKTTPRKPANGAALARASSRRAVRIPIPERRLTNKFRETHAPR